MEDTCAFCVDEQALAGGLHPQVPFALVWADSTWRLFADLTAESSGFSLFAPRRHVAAVSDLEPGEASSLGPTLARLMEALQVETGAEAVYLYAAATTGGRGCLEKLQDELLALLAPIFCRGRR